MTFKTVYLSQTDPQWKDDLLGFGDPGDTIGTYGCALTSIAMLVSGHGYSETPKSLNEKLKNVSGFSSSLIIWGAINKVYPQITLQEQIMCETTDAPLNKIDAALAVGQPVVVRVDSSPAPGLQWHYVLVYARKGDDYLILDPYPYQPGTAREDLLMARYSRGNPLQRSIQQVLIYHCSTTGSDSGISTPPVSTTSTTSNASLGSGPRARVKDSVTLGLNIRSSTDTSSLANLVANVPPGTEVALVEADGPSKVGVNGQWVRVRTASGQEGLAAAWYLDPVSGATASSGTGSSSSPGSETSATSSTTSTTTTGTTSTFNRSRPSMGDGLENVALESPTDRRINNTQLLARIWNKYGGLLIAIADKMGFDPAIAVAIIAQESGGYAFSADGRMIIRFENHLFYEYWGKKNTATYNDHFQSGNPIWTGHKWRPKSSVPWKEFHGNQGAEWDVFTFASKLDDTAAKKSISMGLPQTLGSNYTVLGFASVQDMFNAFVAGERNQVIAFFDFLQGNGPTATNALKNRDFRTIASVYNGAGNADAYGKAINDHYNAFLALQGAKPPSTTTTTSTTTTSTTSTTSTPVNTTSSTASGSVARVKAEVTAGLNIRSSTDTSSMANVIANAPAGSRLTLVNANDLSKIGVNGQWVQVRTEDGKVGYTAAWFLEKVAAATPSSGTGSTSGSLGGSSTTPVSTPPATSAPTSTPVSTSTPASTQTSDPTTTPNEPVEPQRAPKPQVIVDKSVGARGLSLRETASESGKLVTILKVGTKLTILEPPEKAAPKIGKPNLWILVKEPEGKRGYVSAQFVKSA